MNTQFDAAFQFASFDGLAELRRGGAEDSPDARRAVAQQFEALFLNMMMKQMRSASATIDGGLFDKDKSSVHESMLDQQMALSLSRGQGIGLTDAILRSLGGGASGTAPVSRSSQGFGALGFVRGTREGAAAGSLSGASHAAAGSLYGASHAASAANGFAPQTPEDFVAAVWPHAERAAARLGVPPDVLVAQAALETGWGQHMIEGPRGEPSFNVFGIKANADWQGPRAVVATLEFEGGVPQRRNEPFRVYANLGEAFDDYVNVVGGRPRYAGAVASGTAEGYARGLQAGGYATDPDYASKIISIVERGLPGRGERTAAASSGPNTGGDAT